MLNTKFFVVLSFFLVVHFVPSLSLPVVQSNSLWKSCGGHHVNITKVTVDGCSSGPCKVKRGDSLNVTVEFTPDRKYKELDNHVCIPIKNFCVELAMPERNACKDGVKCPIVEGKRYKEMLTIPTLKNYPAIYVWANWNLEDPYDGLSLAGCFSLNLEIQ